MNPSPLIPIAETRAAVHPTLTCNGVGVAWTVAAGLSTTAARPTTTTAHTPQKLAEAFVGLPIPTPREGEPICLHPERYPAYRTVSGEVTARGEVCASRAWSARTGLGPFFCLASIRFERWDHNTQFPFRPEVGLSNPPSHVAINDDKPPLSYLAHNHVVYTAMGSGA